MSGAGAPPDDRELRLQALRRRFLAEAAGEHLELERHSWLLGSRLGSCRPGASARSSTTCAARAGATATRGTTAAAGAARAAAAARRRGARGAGRGARRARRAIHRAGERSERLDRAPPSPAAGPERGGRREPRWGRPGGGRSRPRAARERRQGARARGGGRRPRGRARRLGPRAARPGGRARASGDDALASIAACRPAVAHPRPGAPAAAASRSSSGSGRRPRRPGSRSSSSLSARDGARGRPSWGWAAFMSKPFDVDALAAQVGAPGAPRGAARERDRPPRGRRREAPRLMQHELLEAGLATRAVTTGTDALAAVGQHEPAAIVLDLNLRTCREGPPPAAPARLGSTRAVVAPTAEGADPAGRRCVRPRRRRSSTSRSTARAS